jgi:hypothetical protein
MSDEEKKEPHRTPMFRIVPQIKTFEKGTVLKTKQDLYYSIEEDIVETGGEDNFSPIFAGLSPSTAGAGGTIPVHAPTNSFSQSADFIHKESTVMFVEAAQFRADDNKIYVRAQLLTKDKAVWVNIARVSQRQWGYMIRSAQKELIKSEIETMFEIIST